MARKGGKDRGLVNRRGSWWVRLVHNGRERWHKCDTKSQAKALYQRLRADIREERFFPEKFKAKQTLTLRAWLARCLEGSANRNRVNETLYNRRWSLLIGRRLLAEISTDTLRQIQRKMQLKLRPRPVHAPKDVHPKRVWSDATVNRHFAYLKHVFALALKDGHIQRNPVAGITFFPEVTKTRFFSEAELIRLQGVMDPKDWALIALAVETGLRREEQFGLKWTQVDLEHSYLVLPMPKGGKTRYVPLSEQAKHLLRSFDSVFTSAWVFPSVLGHANKANPKDDTRPMDSRAFLRRAFEPALRKAGITGVSWHTLRHTAASRRVAVGVDLFAVKEILGHRNIQTTLRYAHLSPGHLQDAVNRGSFSGTVTTTGTRARGGEMTTSQPVEYLVRPAGFEPATLSLEG